VPSQPEKKNLIVAKTCSKGTADPVLMIINFKYEVLRMVQLGNPKVKCVGTGGVLAAKGDGLSGDVGFAPFFCGD
jgi:hypothetical protein